MLSNGQMKAIKNARLQNGESNKFTSDFSI